MDNHTEEIRKLLIFLCQKANVSQKEITEALRKGMRVSLTTLNEFIHKRRNLNFTRHALIELVLYLTEKAQEKSSHPTNEENNLDPDSPETIKRLLSSIGIDEFLEKAGYLPYNAKSIRVLPKRYQFVLELATTFEFIDDHNAELLFQDFMSLASKRVLLPTNQISPTGEHLTPETDSCSEIINNLLQWESTLGLKERWAIIEQLKSIQKQSQLEGKSAFNQQEAFVLLRHTIIQQKLIASLPNFGFKIQDVEFVNISLPIQDRHKYENDSYKSLYQKLLAIAQKEELTLKYTPINDSFRRHGHQEYLFHPVVKVKITCGLYQNHSFRQHLELAYTSSNTKMESSFNALALNFGLNQELEQINIFTQTLNKELNGWVKAQVTFSYNQTYYRSTELHRDGIKASIQAVISATLQWVEHQAASEKLHVETYIENCVVISDLREKLSHARENYHSLSLLDTNQDYQGEDIPFIAQTAQAQLNKIKDKEIYRSHQLVLHTIIINTKLLSLRVANTIGDILQAKNYIDEIEQIFREDSQLEKELAPLYALLRSEKVLYELSTGIECDLFDALKSSDWLPWKDIVSNIIDNINPRSYYKEAGRDVYNALSEIYANQARICLYLSLDEKELEIAFNLFLKAAYLASRIGLVRVMAQWITLAGRVAVRIKDKDLALEAIHFSEKLMKQNLTYEASRDFKDAVFSEIYLLQGEFYFFLDNNREEAFLFFLRALKGSINLNLNRRICDSLFNLYRCSKNLGNLSIEDALSLTYSKVSPKELGSHLEKKSQETTNYASSEVYKLLHKLWEREDQPSCHEIRAEFFDLVKGIWNKWHKEASHFLPQQDSESSPNHPIIECIEKGNWLNLL